MAQSDKQTEGDNEAVVQRSLQVGGLARAHAATRCRLHGDEDEQCNDDFTVKTAS